MDLSLLRRSLGALLLLALSAAASAQSVLSYRSSQGDFVGQGQTLSIASPQYTFNAQLLAPVGQFVRFVIDGPDHFLLLDIAAPPGQLLVPGVYEEAARASFRGASPGLDFGGDGRGCNRVLGRVTILEIDITNTNPPQLNRFAANFEQHCEETGPPLFGEIRFNSAAPVGVTPGPGDDLPDPFTLQAQSPVKANTTVTSNTVTISGVNGSVPVTIAGGEWSKNAGPFETAAGTVTNGDTIVVRLQSSGTPAGIAQATLTVGSFSTILSVTTYVPGSQLSGFHYVSTPGDFIGQGLEKLYLVPPNIIEATRNFDNGVTFRITAVRGVNWTLDFALPGNATPVPGRYTGATRFPFQAPGAPGLSMSGEGRGCNQLTGEFTILEAAFAPDGTVQRFAANYTQLCDGSTKPVRGEIRYNSTVDLGGLMGSGTPGTPTGCKLVTDFRVDTDGDGIPDCVEPAESTDPLVKDNDVFGVSRLFAMQQYRDFLGREGEEDGIAYWSGQADATSRAQVISVFMHSAEFEQRVAPVVRLYLGYFLRGPDPSGLAFWVSTFRGGATLDDISQAFAASPEFDLRYGALDDAAFVDRAYRNVLGRPPDPEGNAFWLARLASGEVTRGRMMTFFTQAGEFIGLTRNEVVATMLYFGLLRRTAEPAEFLDSVNFLDAGNPELSLIQSFLGTPEYRARFF